jgi:ribosomal protein S18 acetylase RimI-like enzyme
VIDVRRATESDANALAGIAERTFRDTFADSNTAEDMNLHCESAYGAPIQRREILDPRWVNLLAESGGALIGFAQLRLLQPKDGVAAERPSELYRIYVSREWHGRGVAQELMREVLAAAVAAQSDGMWLGVWERNLKAQAFYRKFGFEAVGEHVFLVGQDRQRDLIMARSI